MLEYLRTFIDLESIQEQIIAFMPQLLVALVLALAFYVLIKLSERMIAAAMSQRTSMEARGLLMRMVKYAIVVIACLTVADQLGINVTSLIAGAGIAGLAISFAAQDTIANVISGVTIVIDRPFTQGDWISIGNMHAMVTEIRMRTTVLSTFDNETVVVPNKQLAQERITNYTLTPLIRVKVPIGIAYKENTQQAREILLSLVENDDRIIAEPKPTVIVKELAPSSVTIELRFWIEDSINKFPMFWEYTEKAKKALDENNIQIPYPHLQLFVEETEGVRMLAGKTR